jgi:hypothetical protein
MAGLSTLTGSLSTQFKWNAQQALVGSAYTATTNGSGITKNYNVGTAQANAASGGCDEVFSFQQAIAGGGSATINLMGMTDMLQRNNVVIVRIKGYQIRLLNTSDDPTIVTPVAGSVTVTNNGPSVPTQLDFGSGGSGLSLALTTSGGGVSSLSIATAGSGYPANSTFLASPNQAGGSGAVVAVTANSSGVPSTVTLLAAGAGYTNATTPATVLGCYTVQSGGAHMYFDVSAAGFAPVSNVSRNLLIINNDPVNTASIELDVFGATT